MNTIIAGKLIKPKLQMKIESFVLAQERLYIMHLGHVVVNELFAWDFSITFETCYMRMGVDALNFV